MMAKRRRPGDGSLAQRASDGLWIGTVEAGYYPNGGRRRLTVSSKSKTEATRKLRDLQRRVALEGPPAVDAPLTMTVAGWANQWLEMRKRNVRPGTWDQYRASIVGHVIPAIGRRRLSALTVADMEAVTAAIVDQKGLSITTANRAHRTLLKMLHDAQLNDYRVPVRVFEAPVPQPLTDVRMSIPADQVRALIRTAAGLPDHTRWDAALLVGMRQGECLGLTWDSVDLDAGVIRIEWQLQELPYKDGPGSGFALPRGFKYRHLTGRYCLTEPKTKKSKREVPLIDYLWTGLREWRQVAPENPYGLVWATETGGPRNRHSDNAAWQQLQELAAVAKPDGGHYVLHEARHGTATLLMEEGAHMNVVKAIMGHTTAKTTHGYQHVSPALARQAVDRVAATLQIGPA